MHKPTKALDRLQSIDKCNLGTFVMPEELHDVLVYIEHLEAQLAAAEEYAKIAGYYGNDIRDNNLFGS